MVLAPVPSSKRPAPAPTMDEGTAPPAAPEISQAPRESIASQISTAASRQTQAAAATDTQASKRDSSFAKETKLDTSKQPSTGKPAQNASETSDKVKAVTHEPKTDVDVEKSPRSKLASDPPPPTDIPSASLEHKDRAEQEGETQDQRAQEELDPDAEARAKRKKEKRKKKKRKEKRRARELSPERMAGDTPEKVKPEHMKRKERKNMRKMNETDNYAMAARSKQIWNELRRMDLPNEKRVELSNELYKMVGGKVKTMVFAHDTSRVIQCLIKYGTQEHKNAIFEELKDNIVELCKSKYAKFVVRKLLKYGTKGQRLHVFQSLYGNVRKLIKHKEACETIELAYNEYANAQQRHAFIEEFYGPSFAVFKTDEIKTLDQILATHPEKANSILNNMKDSLTSLVDKTLLQYSIVHRIFLDYFLHAPAKARSEMIEVVREHLVHMVHTKEGARVAMMCLWSGTAKDRKAFIKSLKTFVVKICKEEYGHLALLALFDCVDDTKIVHKVILEEMLKSLPEVAQDQYGRKVLLYLLSPRDKKNFHPDIIKLLEPADDPVQNPHSKKEASARRGELLDAVSRPLVQYVAHNAKALVSDNAMLILLLNIITHVKSDPTDAMRAVALLAAEPFAIDSEHIIEQTAGHLTMKKLIVNDGERMKQGQQVLFSSILLDILPEGALKSWAACNRGCFILCFLLELKHEEITTKVQKELSGIKNSLQKMEFKGAHILLQKLT